MPGRNLRMVPRTLRVPVVNLTGEIIPEGAVAFDRSGEAFPGVVPVVPATEETTLFGIITQPLPPSTYGDAVVSGVVEVTLENGADATHAAPGSDGKLQSADGGRAEILFYDAENSRALLLLGAGGGESAIPAYNGYFTIIDASEYDEEGNVTGFFVQVVYGMHPDVSYCGITDIGDVPRSEKISIQPSGVISIGVHVINMAESPTDRDYRLCAAREDDTSWIPDDAPEGALTAYWEIGTVRVVDGEIIIDQIWQDGKIYFSRNYYV